MKSKATEGLLAGKLEGKVVRINCGTSEKMWVTINFAKNLKIACIIQENQCISNLSRVVDSGTLRTRHANQRKRLRVEEEV